MDLLHSIGVRGVVAGENYRFGCAGARLWLGAAEHHADTSQLGNCKL